MAGVSDAPFRRICQSLGAGLTTSEMITAKTGLWHSRKSSLRLRDCNDSPSLLPRSVQIAGSEPRQMAQAAVQCVAEGAEIVDINMGCPAKKVCSQAAGSALLRDETLVADILIAVVNAVTVPVTLKIRTGWCPASKNGTRIARIAEQSGIQALTVHGRTRACRFAGEAEYETIAAIVEAVDIPVIANGDIDSPAKAKWVLQTTGANAVMVGRAAQGQPWLIREIDHYLRFNTLLETPGLTQVFKIVSEHLQALYNFYGEYSGVRIARKHLKWYSQRLIEHCYSNAKPLSLSGVAVSKALNGHNHNFTHSCDNHNCSNDSSININNSSNISRCNNRCCNNSYRRRYQCGEGDCIHLLVQQFVSTVNSTESPDEQQASVRNFFERLITREEIAA